MSSQLPAPAAKVLDALLEGNERYALDRPRHPHQGRATRADLTEGQHPVAAILACSDARVPPTLVFDQGLGDLFVVRNAGQVLTPGALASLEFAVLELDVPLIVILAHEACGAIKAATETFGTDRVPHAHLAQVLAPLAPAVAVAARRARDPNAIAEVACAAGEVHLAMTLEALRRTEPVVAPRIAAGRLGVVGLTYELSSGRTRLLEDVAAAR